LPEDEPLALSVTHADGRVTRWGPGEPDGGDIPNDLTFGDSIPGGDSTLSTSLLRRIDVPHADEALFDDVHCYGAGGRTAWRGYMGQFPRTHGDGFGVSPGAVGWSAVLRWDTGFREIYVDRSASSWSEPDLARRIALAGTFDTALIGATTDAGLTFSVPGGQSIPSQALCERYYYPPGGVTLGKFAYQASEAGDFTGYEARTLRPAGATSIALTIDSALHFDSFSASASQLMMRVYRSAGGAATQPASGTTLIFSKLAVYGSHNLATRTTATGEPDGLYASDVVANIVQRAAPQLTFTTGAGGSIEPTTFAIPHLVYRDPITAEFAISDINKYHLYDWGVSGNREFFFRQPDPYRLLWEARLSDGAHLDADGDTAEQVINGVFVIYTDATGVTKTVGPTTGGPFDNTDTALEDTSSTNPINAWGLGPKFVPLTLSFPTTLAGATQIGAVYLAERSLAGRRGTVTLTGTATHPTEGKVPCWRVRSGDWISLKDLNGASVPRKIIDKTYTHGNRQVRLQLDNTVAKLDAILARVGIQAGIATGGGF
jgi:hypothetical protein